MLLLFGVVAVVVLFLVPVLDLTLPVQKWWARPNFQSPVGLASFQ